MKYKVLITDDSVMNRELLAEILGEQYEYIFAEDGEKLIEILGNDTDADIILLDINMPKMNGFDVLEIMNKRHWIEEIPVIVISAEIGLEFLRRAYELGASDYISRPFLALAVQHRVANTLAVYAKQRRLVQLVEEQVYNREKVNDTMINVFSHVIELRNNESGTHTLHMRSIAELLLHRLVQITDKYPLTEDDISTITTLSALHDIGKIAIPEEILNKPGKLTDEEWKIMKAHTTYGDDVLNSVPIAETDSLIKTAHEICRWHHERWDGKGYPDGLKGDEIPISAQVVSIADVYDALTSDRCYKKAFSHDRAILMICNGECGEFNPLLIRCLKDVEKQLRTSMTLKSTMHDYADEAQRLAGEMLNNNELPLDDRSRRLFINEKVKKEFFMQQAGGIQFEYDAVLRRVFYINRYEENPVGRTLILNDGDDVVLLSPEDWQRLVSKLGKTTREKPYATMDVLVPVNGIYRWHRLNARTIWPIRGNNYISALGQFTDIHDKITNAGLRSVLGNGEKLGIIYKTMGTLFDVVRIVDPDDARVLKFNEQGELVETEEKCFGLWGRCECCTNCSSKTAMSADSWVTKLEIMNGRIYSVISKHIKLAKKDCVIEIAFRVNDKGSGDQTERGIERTNLLFLDFYRDALTSAYSRMYLEDFKSNFENSDAVAIIDVDDFKQINDTYGHPVGDAVLKYISDIIVSSVRDNDVLIRYGGDEFLLIFTEVSELDFNKYMNAIRENVAHSKIEEYPYITLSVSIGGSYSCKPLAKAIEQADREMYKNKGKDQDG